MRLLVTGGAGFIGSNHIHHLLHARGVDASCCPDASRYEADVVRDEDIEILNVDAMTYAADPANLAGIDGAEGYRLEKADITDRERMDGLFEEFQPDAVVHFAAESHVDRSIAGGEVFARTNVVGTQILLDAARRYDVDRFLHVSTDEVYGSIEEGSFTEDSPYDPSSPYSASKAGSDLLALAHHKTYGLGVVVTRCTNNYGPRQHGEKLLPTIIRRALADEAIPIYGDGRNVRDWLYVKDHCAALETVLAKGEAGTVYNIAGRDERENLDVARNVLEHLGKPESLIRFVEDRPGHDRRYSLDDSRMRALGWEPQTSFDDGLSDTVGWLARVTADA